MGVNLVPEVRVDDMLILEREFIEWGTPPQSPIQVNDGSVEDGCATYGPHKILKFDTHCLNIGNEELVIGRRDRDDLFKDSKIHGRIFKYPFFKYELQNNSGREYVTLKHPFCLTDDRGDCDNQKIGVNRKDTYAKDHQCQFIIIDGIEDGNYMFKATVNLFSIESIKKGGQNGIIIKEDRYDDNTIEIPVTITGNKIKDTRNPPNKEASTG